MAAVTQNTRAVQNVPGSSRQMQFNITIATSGDTLLVPFRQVNSISANDVAITKMVPTVSGFGASIAFTTTGVVTGALVDVQGV